MKNKKITIIVAAYNAEKNIKRLLASLADQDKVSGYDTEFLVYSDMSTDKTTEFARKIEFPSLRLLEGKNRLGFSGVVKKFIESNKSDYLIFLNDDILLLSKNFITSITESLKKNSNVGLACVDIKPVEISNFVQKANYSSFKAYRKMALSLKKGSNVFTCDGKVLILSRNFCKSLSLPKDLSLMGNVDSYLYFSCLKNKFKYLFIKGVVVGFVFPSNIQDYLSWTSRNNSNGQLLAKSFGKVVFNEFKKPNVIYAFMLFEFLKNPIASLFVYLASFWIHQRSKKIARNFNPLWDTIITSKNFK